MGRAHRSAAGRTAGELSQAAYQVPWQTVANRSPAPSGRSRAGRKTRPIYGFDLGLSTSVHRSAYKLDMVDSSVLPKNWSAPTDNPGLFPQDPWRADSCPFGLRLKAAGMIGCNDISARSGSRPELFWFHRVLRTASVQFCQQTRCFCGRKPGLHGRIRPVAFAGGVHPASFRGFDGAKSQKTGGWPVLLLAGVRFRYHAYSSQDGDLRSLDLKSSDGEWKIYAPCSQ